MQAAVQARTACCAPRAVAMPALKLATAMSVHGGRKVVPRALIGSWAGRGISWGPRHAVFADCIDSPAGRSGATFPISAVSTCHGCQQSTHTACSTAAKHLHRQPPMDSRPTCIDDGVHRHGGEVPTKQGELAGVSHLERVRTRRHVATAAAAATSGPARCAGCRERAHATGRRAATDRSAAAAAVAAEGLTPATWHAAVTQRCMQVRQDRTRSGWRLCMRVCHVAGMQCSLTDGIPALCSQGKKDGQPLQRPMCTQVHSASSLQWLAAPTQGVQACTGVFRGAGFFNKFATHQMQLRAHMDGGMHGSYLAVASMRARLRRRHSTSEVVHEAWCVSDAMPNYVIGYAWHGVAAAHTCAQLAPQLVSRDEF